VPVIVISVGLATAVQDVSSHHGEGGSAGKEAWSPGGNGTCASEPGRGGSCSPRPPEPLSASALARPAGGQLSVWTPPPGPAGTADLPAGRGSDEATRLRVLQASLQVSIAAAAACDALPPPSPGGSTPAARAAGRGGA
jgi:hypothetical protein